MIKKQYQIVREDNDQAVVPYTFQFQSDALRLCTVLNNDNLQNENNTNPKYYVKTITKN